MRRIILATLTIFAFPSICNAEPVYLHCTHGDDNGADEITVNEQTGTVSIDGGSAAITRRCYCGCSPGKGGYWTAG